VLARIHTSAVSGISATAVEVEVRVRDSGVTRFTIIGLGDNAVREAKDRVESAIKQSGFMLPDQILVNLAPAELKKEGSSFDVPIAVAILVASGQIQSDSVNGKAFYGELSLDGRIKPVRGIIVHTIESMRAGVHEVIVPRANQRESSLITEIKSVGVESLAQVTAYIVGDLCPEQLDLPGKVEKQVPKKSLSEVQGQEIAKRALVVAAAGSHNILFVGVPGAGKSMLAERFPNILPPLSRREVLEVVRIHSIAGLPITDFLNAQRPFRSPHFGTTEPGLIGGGTNPRPGEISLSHHGVLFLDEFPEFRRGAIESMRAPLETGRVSITRANARVAFPARFQLIAAMNPCPCGRLGVYGTSCMCSRTTIQNYLKKLSQPILDRIDLHVDLNPVPIEEIAKGKKSNNPTYDETLQQQVVDARRRALERTGNANAFLSNQEITDSLNGVPKALRLLEALAEKRHLSARGYFRVLKVARTIADIEQLDQVLEEHVAEAAGYRSLDMLQKYCAGC